MSAKLHEALTQICQSREVIYKLLDRELRHLKFCCHKYHDEGSYYRYGELKKIHNLLKYVLDQCDDGKKS